MIILIIVCLVAYIITINSASFTTNLHAKDKEVVIPFNYNNFNKKFKEKIKLKIESNPNKLKVISIKWSSVENTVKYANRFLYEITCEGSKCNSVSFSQIPAFDFTLFSNIYIEPGYDQEYTIKIIYNGKNDSLGYFKGEIIAVEEIADQQKYEEFLKERESKRKYRENLAKKSQELDDE